MSNYDEKYEEEKKKAAEAEERLDLVFDAAFKTNDPAMLDWVTVKFRLKSLIQGERILREMLWHMHGCDSASLYGDDGERSCNSCMIDFVRQSPLSIKERIDQLAMEKISKYKPDCGSCTLRFSPHCPEDTEQGSEMCKEMIKKHIEKLTDKKTD